LLTVVTTSPRVAPGVLSRAAWRALETAEPVLASAGHAQLPALDEAGIRVVDPGQGAELVRSLASAAELGEPVVWLPDPWADVARVLGELGSVGEGRTRVVVGSADLPGARLLDLVVTMDRLRVECPWDARQTHESLAPHLLEEPYEALDALESGDQQAFCEELGDVLLQVVFHARMAAERDDGTGYTIDDVADGIVAKLKRRHPHVFGDVTVSGADEVKVNWDAIKRAEKEEKRAQAQGLGVPEPVPVSALDGVPFGQPALALAAQLLRRATRAGAPAELVYLDIEQGPGEAWRLTVPDVSGDPAKAGGPDRPGDLSEPAEFSRPGGSSAGEALGRELLRLVARAREAGLDAEMELRAAARRYNDLVRTWELSEHLGYGDAAGSSGMAARKQE
jgi:XTP/dITP diphosphohydrolase